MSAEQPEVSQRSGSRVNDEYDLLLRRYGEAMVRIGELEARLQRLGDDRGGTAGSDEAAVPVTELEPEADAELRQQRDSELSKLRLQVTSLSSRLAQGPASEPGSPRATGAVAGGGPGHAGSSGVVRHAANGWGVRHTGESDPEATGS